MLLLVPPTRTCLLSPRLSPLYFQSFVGLATRLPHPKNLAKYAKSCMYSPIRWNYRNKATVHPLNHRKVGAKKYAWRLDFISFLKELHVQTANLGAKSWKQEDQTITSMHKHKQIISCVCICMYTRVPHSLLFSKLIMHFFTSSQCIPPTSGKCRLTGSSSSQADSKLLPFCIHLNQHEYRRIFGPSRSDIRWEETWEDFPLTYM